MSQEFEHTIHQYEMLYQRATAEINELRAVHEGLKMNLHYIHQLVADQEWGGKPIPASAIRLVEQQSDRAYQRIQRKYGLPDVSIDESAFSYESKFAEYEYLIGQELKTRRQDLNAIKQDAERYIEQDEPELEL